MGLYDYLNGEQVKIFYSPVFWSENEGENVYYSGGGLRGYINGDKLPLKTLYYKYPDDFFCC